MEMKQIKQSFIWFRCEITIFSPGLYSKTAIAEEDPGQNEAALERRKKACLLSRQLHGFWERSMAIFMMFW